jgi:hypothetical protein
MFPKLSKQPIIFEDANILEACPNPPIRCSRSLSYLGIHIIVLVHGFHGNQYDLRLFRNVIALS